MDFLSVWKTFTQPNKIVKQSVHLRLSLLSVQRGKKRKLWSKSRCWEAWRRRWWSVSARRWVIGDKISVWPDFGQAGATLPARSEELSLPIVRREGRRGRILACPAIQSQATRRPESSSSARSTRSPRFSFYREELERRHLSVLGSNRLILS